MKLCSDIVVYGDVDFRGKCPIETLEQVTFFNWLRRQHPEYGKIAIHVRNEGNRHHAQTVKQKAEGMTPGAADIIIPASPAFVCEMKRQDHTKSTWQEGQREYLLAAKEAGAFVCVALGWEGAKEAFEEWKNLRSGLANGYMQGGIRRTR